MAIRVDPITRCQCGTLIPLSESLCLECRLAALQRMIMLREHLLRARPGDPPSLPYTYRVLN